jgi:poly(A) polymerase
MELFPEAPLEEQLNICRYLKVSKKDLELVEYVYHFRKKINEEILRLNGEDLAEWGYMYANPHASTCLQVIAARLPEELRPSLLEQHKKRQEFLAAHIERIANKKPIVTAFILQQHGVLPGKNMGILLKEAEKIAIHYNLHEADKIMKKLKQSPLWTQEVDYV